MADFDLATFTTGRIHKKTVSRESYSNNELLGRYNLNPHEVIENLKNNVPNLDRVICASEYENFVLANEQFEDVLRVMGHDKNPKTAKKSLASIKLLADRGYYIAAEHYANRMMLKGDYNTAHDYLAKAAYAQSRHGNRIPENVKDRVCRQMEDLESFVTNTPLRGTDVEYAQRFYDAKKYGLFDIMAAHALRRSAEEATKAGKFMSEQFGLTAATLSCEFSKKNDTPYAKMAESTVKAIADSGSFLACRIYASALEERGSFVQSAYYLKKILKMRPDLPVGFRMEASFNARSLQDRIHGSAHRITRTPRGETFWTRE